MNDKNIMDYWDFGENYDPRPSQEKALKWLEQQDAKYLLIEAPVGVGKSAIGVAYSKYLSQRTDKGDSYILTPQRILQKQYEEAFSDIDSINLTTLYGKTNYRCKSKKTSCEVGSIVKPRCKHCPYDIARNRAIKASNTVLNYTLALTAFNYTDLFEHRKLLIMDECHTLEQHLVNFDAVKIQEWMCKKYKLPFSKQTDIHDAVEWIKDNYVEPLTQLTDQMMEDADFITDKMGSELSKAEIKLLRETNDIVSHHDEIQQLIHQTSSTLTTQFVLVNNNISFEFKRLTGSHAFNQILKPKAERFLFMSSTILNKEGFCEDLGIPAEETAFLSLDSDFPVENRRVFYFPQMKMNYGWNDKTRTSERNQTSTVMQQLCDNHKDESGIIHTTNFALSTWAVNELEDKVNQKIFHHNPDGELDRNSVIDQFLEYDKPSILISPSSTEGLDLKYELGNFAIILKTPFGYLGDQWIKRRMELSGEWYRRQAMIGVIQGGGRIVRAVDDRGTVYILDESFDRLLQMSQTMIPQWWKDAYDVV